MEGMENLGRMCQKEPDAPRPTELFRFIGNIILSGLVAINTFSIVPKKKRFS